MNPSFKFYKLTLLFANIKPGCWQFQQKNVTKRINFAIDPFILGLLQG